VHRTLRIPVVWLRAHQRAEWKVCFVAWELFAVACDGVAFEAPIPRPARPPLLRLTSGEHTLARAPWHRGSHAPLALSLSRGYAARPSRSRRPSNASAEEELSPQAGLAHRAKQQRSRVGHISEGEHRHLVALPKQRPSRHHRALVNPGFSTSPAIHLPPPQRAGAGVWVRDEWVARG
jgi:hypothetical protein